MGDDSDFYSKEYYEKDGRDPFLEIDWLIQYHCNYRCPYCFFDGNWDEVLARDKPIAADKWISAICSLRPDPSKILVTLTGGEPTLYPGFIDIVSGLARRVRKVSFDTNLSQGAVFWREFVECVEPGAPVRINASFHPTFCKDPETFREKLRFLESAGYRVPIHFIAHPPQIAEIDRYWEFFKGFHLQLFAFRGEFEGRRYPESYTDAEYEKVFATVRDTQSVAAEKDWLDGFLNQVEVGGRACKAGFRYVRMDVDGTVFRCSETQNRPLGNIFDSGFRLSNGPMPCDVRVCPCEFRWIAQGPGLFSEAVRSVRRVLSGGRV